MSWGNEGHHVAIIQRRPVVLVSSRPGDRRGRYSVRRNGGMAQFLYIRFRAPRPTQLSLLASIFISKILNLLRITHPRTMLKNSEKISLVLGGQLPESLFENQPSMSSISRRETSSLRDRNCLPPINSPMFLVSVDFAYYDHRNCGDTNVRAAFR